MSHGFNFEKNDGSFSTSSKMAQELMVDADYIPALDIKISQGRNFSTAVESDKYGAALVNETLMQELGWKDAINKRLRFKYGEERSEKEQSLVLLKISIPTPCSTK